MDLLLQTLSAQVNRLRLKHNGPPTVKLNPCADYKYLVFSGGGMRGLSFAGAVSSLEKKGLELNKLKGIGGVSAGSIIASLLAIGYTPDELNEILPTINYNKIASDDMRYISEGVNFCRNWG